MPDTFRLVRPLLHALDPESAHALTIWALRNGLVGQGNSRSRPLLETDIWGIRFPNPLGLAAGFDKNARVFEPLLRTGFGFVEVGSVTPRPQVGNPRPRMFRLPEDAAVINRLGFNNQGMDAVAQRLENRSISTGVVGVNIGCNRDSRDEIADYLTIYRRLGPLADFTVINVSSPNTPGLRDLQFASRLAPLLESLAAERAGHSTGPLLVKLAPDLSVAAAVAAADIAFQNAADGLVISNTTVARSNDLQGKYASEEGGLSGTPLFEQSTRLLRAVYNASQGRMPIIGVGGIASAKDAWVKLRAGASLIQLYTGLIYKGPGLVEEILDGLEQNLARTNAASIADVVGSDV